jgi:glutamate formiminotransferase/formiminotetrahydrofolate cyclodeaminase
MVPFGALYETGKNYLQKQGRSVGIPVRDVLEIAVQSLGLRDTAGFEIDKRVLGLPQIKETDLLQSKVQSFVDEVSRESPAPGGGSVAALAGALGAALNSMVANLAIGKRGSERVEGQLKPVAERAQELKDLLLKAVDEDTNAFNAYLAARKLPARTAEEKNKKEMAQRDGLKQAVEVPLKTAYHCYEVIELAHLTADKGNPASVSDAGVSAHMAFAGLKGAILNVQINLKNISDQKFNQKMITTCKKLETDALKRLNRITRLVDEKIRIGGKPVLTDQD